MATSELTPQQRKFARAYVENGGNGTHAALAAGYAKSGAATQASRLLKRANVIQYISEIEQPALEKAQVTMERIVAELAKIAFANMKDFITINADGQAYIDLSDATEDQLAALQSFEVVELPPHTLTKNGVEFERDVLRVKVRTWDKVKALKELAEIISPSRGGINAQNLQINNFGADSGTEIGNMQDLALRVAFVMRRGIERKKQEEREKAQTIEATATEAE